MKYVQKFCTIHIIYIIIEKNQLTDIITGTCFEKFCGF